MLQNVKRLLYWTVRNRIQYVDESWRVSLGASNETAVSIADQHLEFGFFFFVIIDHPREPRDFIFRLELVSAGALEELVDVFQRMFPSSLLERFGGLPSFAESVDSSLGILESSWSRQEAQVDVVPGKEGD
jgi:hypothetical protein